MSKTTLCRCPHCGEETPVRTYQVFGARVAHECTLDNGLRRRVVLQATREKTGPRYLDVLLQEAVAMGFTVREVEEAPTDACPLNPQANAREVAERAAVHFRVKDFSKLHPLCDPLDHESF